MTETISHYLIPAILLIPSFLFFSGGKDYLAAFLDGVKTGLNTSFSLIPSLTLVMCAVSMFSSSGAADALSALISPACSAAGLPGNVIPLLLVRPFSGSAASAAYVDLMRRSGADGFSAFLSSVIMGSSDTVFYIVSIYFSVCSKVKRTRYTYPVAVASSLFCIFFSCFICRLFFKNY